jgi:hypothetical protein
MREVTQAADLGECGMTTPAARASRRNSTPEEATMARPLKYPQLAQLRNPGDEVTLHGGAARAKARWYAKYHKFPIEITRVPGGILVRRLEQAA